MDRQLNENMEIEARFHCFEEIKVIGGNKIRFSFNDVWFKEKEIKRSL